MIWVIILKYAVSSFQDDSPASASPTSSRLSTKDALLAWAQRNTAGHAGVNVENFSMSWRDGLAFCALIHNLDPSLIPYGSLKAENAAQNIELALSISEQRLDVARLFDPLDVLDLARPDEKSIMTYVAIWREATSKYRHGSVFCVSHDGDLKEAFAFCLTSQSSASLIFVSAGTESHPRREGQSS